MLRAAGLKPKMEEWSEGDNRARVDVLAPNVIHNTNQASMGIDVTHVSTFIKQDERRNNQVSRRVQEAEKRKINTYKEFQARGNNVFVVPAVITEQGVLGPSFIRLIKDTEMRAELTGRHQRLVNGQFALAWRRRIVISVLKAQCLAMRSTASAYREAAARQQGLIA